MGFSLSVLAASLGVGQFLRQTIALQWIFAFVIMGVLFISTLVIVVPGIFGKEVGVRRSENTEDTERAPLLADN